MVDLNKIKYSTDKATFDLNVIHTFLKNSYWSKNIPRVVVEQAIKNSFCIAAFIDEQQIGFARLITDYSTFAYLADVFILEMYQQQGIGSALIQHLIKEAESMNLRRILLATRDAHDLYAKYGFTSLNHPQNFMEIVRPNIYLDAG
ncbi:MAG: GNAT family N-acetyltransferase [Acinetobacter populi]|uniref:GNAT family N-acetyltransferase n=1 Tax=Acinetobacter populi TaxID=1582270 RepID=UPI0023545F1F|nr:GNAT family N-acetyltransferase [Acinetobacter populi]MCH4249080.1 GNAT family N-acetyltransferase [Acinetobacter populi]